MYKPEILAPCGDYNSVIYSINAGADAVYLGAGLFSARAYAKNLTNDEIIKAIQYAHLHEAKVYLTLNTLLKNSEINDAVNLIKPLYENGLDAIIVQDMGLLYILKEIFPLMDIHASTQMSIMSREGVKFLKNHNVTRVVPARELSINEIKELKNEGLEIECFVHGAMCYSYSGKCLFSSIAGGRSGNRGRCAGPCRKMYDIYDLKGNAVKSKCYPLSMKDMCTVDCTGQLIDTKVDSFKIEGRMKSKEYSAGVTSIYKKTALNYLKDKSYKVTKHDKDVLSRLYVRSQLQEGYLNKHNGKDMITLKNPSYNQVDTSFVNDYAKFEPEKTVPVDICISIFKDSGIYGSISFNDYRYDYTGDIVKKADNHPVSEDIVKKQICKLGNTFFYCNECTVYTDGESFVSVKELNDFRRQLISGLEDLIFTKRTAQSEFDLCIEPVNNVKNNTGRLIIGISSLNQLKAANKCNICGEYIIDLFSDVFDNNIDDLNYGDLYIRLTPIVRDNKLSLIENRLRKVCERYDVKGIYVNSIDGLNIALKFFDKDNIYGDSGLYVFNDYSAKFFKDYLREYTVSFENNYKELMEFREKADRQIVIYGNIPLMYSAGCIAKTCDNCNKNIEGYYLVDENKRKFYSKCNHSLCYNTIYNNVPLCLFGELKHIKDNYSAYRIEFTYESYEEVLEVIKSYKEESSFNIKGNNLHTLGHYKRGVE